MKILKPFKLFEAFDSNKLSKTLGYINDSSKTKFIEDLKALSQRNDIPASKMNDDIFQYLGYRQAMSVINYPEKGDCKYESEWIRGEFCKDGKVKRTWGSGTRNVTCPSCHGTGEAAAIKEDRYIKFWFSTGGQYLGTTITNGTQEVGTSDFSRVIDDYEEIKTFASGAQMKREVQMGDIISFRPYRYVPDWWRTEFSDPYNETIGVIYRQGRHVYAINNETSFKSPSTWRWEQNLPNWRSYGSRVYQISQPRSYEGQIKLLKLKDSSTDPILWNHVYDARTGRRGASDKQKIIDDAAFALVVDVKDLDQSTIGSLSSMKSQRKEDKANALAFKTDDEIKSENIQRYLDSISKNTKIDMDDLRNLNLTFRRLMGFNDAFLIKKYRTEPTDSFNVVLNNIYEILSGNYDISAIERNVIPTIKRSYQNTVYNINESKKMFNRTKELSQYNDNYDIIMDVMKEWGQVMNKALSKMEITNIVDAKMFQIKAKSMLIPKFAHLNSVTQTFSRAHRYGYYLDDINLDKERFLREWEWQKEYIKKL